MKIIELNRMVNFLSDKEKSSEEIASFLEYVIADDVQGDDSADSALCRESMESLFPDPITRAKMYFRLTMSVCREEPEDDGEDANAKEANFFMTEMLKALKQALESGGSLAECKTMIEELLADA